MKRKLTKQELTNYIKRLDKRANDLDDNQINDIILSTFGELSTINFPFSSEYILNLEPYINAGETILAVNIDKDVVDIFDLYVTIENDKEVYATVHGVNVFRDDDSGHRYPNDKTVLWRDGFDVGLVHVKLSLLPQGAKNLVVKFFYHPDENFVDLFVDAKLKLAIQYAVGVSLYDYLHDVPRAEQKRAAMTRVSKTIINTEPTDFQPRKPSMFPVGV